MQREELVKQLVKLHFLYSLDEGKDMTDTGHIQAIFNLLLDHDRIQWVEREGEVVGFVESWRINYAQLGWIICRNKWSFDVQEIETGNIAYVSEVIIKPEYRHGLVIGELKDKFFEKNEGIEFVCGRAQRKMHKPFTMHKVNERTSKLFGRLFSQLNPKVEV